MSLPDNVESRKQKLGKQKWKGVHLIFAFCFLLSIFCSAADDSSGKQELFLPRKFEVALKNGETVGWEQVRRVFVTSGTNEFVFVVPQGLRMDSNPDKVTLVPTDSSYFLTFRILSAVPIGIGKSNTSNPDFCRRYVLDRFPAAQILEEFSKTAASRNGPAFELRSKAEGGMERALCVALVPSEAGVLEFTLNADLSKLADAKAAFHSLLRTFRSNESGKLEITARVLDNS
jgi:hypothetical protein